MLARFLMSVCVFAVSALAQSPSPTHGLYQFRPNDQNLLLHKVGLEAIGSHKPLRFTAPTPESSVTSPRRPSLAPPLKIVRANARGVEFAKKGRMQEASTWCQTASAIDPRSTWRRSGTLGLPECARATWTAVSRRCARLSPRTPTMQRRGAT